MIEVTPQQRIADRFIAAAYGIDPKLSPVERHYAAGLALRDALRRALRHRGIPTAQRRELRKLFWIIRYDLENGPLRGYAREARMRRLRDW